MNILILSCGTRNKIVQYFRKAVNSIGGYLIAADCSELAPALYDADKYYIVPKINEIDYIDVVLDICRKEKVNGILSLIDPELGLLAENTAQFKSINTIVLGSSKSLCEMSLDKYQMYEWLTNHGYNCAKSFLDEQSFLDEINAGKVFYPVIVKPAKGSASMGISKANDSKTLDFLMNQEDGMMIQEYLDGQEIGADVYIDLISGEVVSVFTKKKIKMRAGETDKAVSFKSGRLFDFIEKFVEEVGYRGPIDIDLFEIEEEYYISEVNPRFGGGYPHAYACGVDHMKMIVENLAGRTNKKQIGNYDEDIFMMKYCEVAIKSGQTSSKYERLVEG